MGLEFGEWERRVGRVVERETARLVIRKDGCWFAKCALHYFTGLSDESPLPNNLIASVVKPNNLRAMETDIAHDVCGYGKSQSHRCQNPAYDRFHSHLARRCSNLYHSPEFTYSSD